MYDAYLNVAGLIKGGDVTAHWLADGSRFWYAERAGDSMGVHLVDPGAATRSAFFDTGRLRRALRAALGYEPPSRGVPFETFTLEAGDRVALFSLDGRAFRLDLESYSVTAVAPVPASIRERTTPRRVRESFPETGPDVSEIRSPDGQWFLGEANHNLRLRSTYDGREEPLTTDGTRDDVWEIAGGRLNTVRALGAARWSPDSRSVVAIKSSQTGVPWFPIVHWLKPVEEVQWQRFTKAGQALPQTSLYVVDIASKRQVKLDTGSELDQYFGVIGWTPDGSEVLFLRMNRVFQRLDLMAADPKTGASRIVLTESQPTFIKGIASNPGWGDLFTLLPRSNRFLWISERDGWDHLYLYDLRGNLVRRLTEGRWPVLRVMGVDEANGWVYFTGHAERRVYDTHLYRVGLDGKGFRRLTEDEGQHSAELSPSRRFFLDRHSNLSRPPRVDLRATDGKLIRTLAEADISELRTMGWQPPEEFIVKAADDTTDLWGVMYKPYDFDPTKRYPVVDFLYNGPQTTMVQRAFVSGWPHYAAAALSHLGFIVFSVDGRGTTERGKAFQDVVYKNFGRNEIPDHVATLKQLAAKRPYLDLSRVGIYGGSWGGYMTIRAMVLAPEVYHAGVATYPVADLNHWASPIEPYVGLPQVNREAYEYGSSLRLFDRIKGRLMLVHGTSDVNAHFGATMQIVEALTRAGKPYDLVVFPEANHGFQGATHRYWLGAIRRHFEEHLKPSGGAGGAAKETGNR
jgi:dipeptidyl aminopeptidase/acylaminoacyl peptidase